MQGEQSRSRGDGMNFNHMVELSAEPLLSTVFMRIRPVVCLDGHSAKEERQSPIFDIPEDMVYRFRTAVIPLHAGPY